MLIIGLFTICIALPLCSSTLRTSHYTRLSSMVLIICFILCGFSSLQTIHYDWSIYHSLFHVSSVTYVIDMLLYIAGIIILIATNTADKSIKNEYSLLVIFVITGAVLIVSSNNLISIYISLELQSFALYIITSIYTNQITSTSSSIKYFILGAVSSAFILLGISIIYKEYGVLSLTGLSQISNLVQVNSIIGLLIIICGFMFKVSAVPFHSWAPDVYQGVPNHIAIALISLPKISLFTILSIIIITCACSTILLFIAIISLIVGTIGGLRQIKIRRLLAFSTISHVGFILLCLAPANSIENIFSLIFYIVQYSLITLLLFICLIIFEIFNNNSINYTIDLQGKGIQYTLLSFTFILCLFSIAGIPPLTGFYAKLFVLKNSIVKDITFVYIIAIVCSVISASYYLRLIKIIIFDSGKRTEGLYRQSNVNCSIIAYIISVLIAFICLFVLDPNLIINSVSICALAIF